jgi:inorganic pyrophosphatase
MGEGHGPLNIVVLMQASVVLLCLIPSKVIGVMQMVDREADDKIIAVAEQDLNVSDLNDVEGSARRSGSLRKYPVLSTSLPRNS